MAMNRETKRSVQGQADADADGAASMVRARPLSDGAAERRAPSSRNTPMQFLREVRDELRQVAWPSRAELVNYSMVVLITLVVMVLLIFVLNFVFGKGVFFMFQK